MMKLDVLFGCEWLVQDLLIDRRYGWADGGVCRTCQKFGGRTLDPLPTGLSLNLDVLCIVLYM